MSSTKWSGEEILQFVEIFERFQILWNMRSAEYKVRSKRDIAWTELLEEAKSAGLPILTLDEVKKRVRVIRTVYAQELKKIASSKKSGAGTDDVYIPKLKWFSRAHSFLQDVTVTRVSENNLGIDVIDLPASEVEKEENQPTNNLVQVSKRQRTNRMRDISHALGRLEKINQQNKDNEDEFEYFGLNIASEMRKMPLRKAYSIQDKITAILRTHRMEEESYQDIPQEFEIVLTDEH